MIWSVPCLFFTGIVLLIDFIVRRKKWSENAKSEKTGLVLTLLVSFPYVFCSVYGVFFGILGPRSDSPFMKALYNIVLIGGTGTVFVCIIATIASLVLRKLGNAAAANRSLLLGLLYCAVMTGASFLV